MEIGTVARNIRGKETAVCLLVRRSCGKDGRCPADGRKWTPNIVCVYLLYWSTQIPLINSIVVALLPIDGVTRSQVIISNSFKYRFTIVVCFKNVFCS